MAQSTILSTVKMYYDMASDSSKTGFLVKDAASVQFLVYVLEDKNQEVVTLALKALKLLSVKRDNRYLLSKVFGVVEALQAFTASCHDGECLHLANEVLNRVTNPHTPLRERQNTDTTPVASSKLKKRKSPSRPFLGSANCHAKTVILHIDGLLTQDCRKSCQDAIIKVRGVISITFDMSRGRCIIRTKAELDPQLLVDAVSSLEEFEAHQVVRDETGQEMIVRTPTTPSNKENMCMPEYLPDDDSPVKDKAVVDPKNVGKKGAGWFSSATNFLAKSFYW